ncbi:uncharacterized protein STEHIDRAFT_163279 [Stereum hirsutum FP-91666 SS1]|uniref:Uncharacterized protein n=1 Tax=Stereum hirsutum (strain FP-91666) TaxID=721885 RepID=R7RYY6_STEHR|nr:uncharacterized protein STEHIDRAFT_163279 [Stereum hirsutum FP-91666 SS1]EIM80028.1 hypothetical protein STEHIDRAFT_163279 [Stereum hirsutum FP-91666 SS1]
MTPEPSPPVNHSLCPKTETGRSFSPFPSVALPASRVKLSGFLSLPAPTPFGQDDEVNERSLAEDSHLDRLLMSRSLPELSVLYAGFGFAYREGLDNIFVLSGIPIAVPTVLSIIQISMLTTDKLTIDRSTIKPYSPFSADDHILLTAEACRASCVGLRGAPNE